MWFVYTIINLTIFAMAIWAMAWDMTLVGDVSIQTYKAVRVDPAKTWFCVGWISHLIVLVGMTMFTTSTKGGTP